MTPGERDVIAAAWHTQRADLCADLNRRAGYAENGALGEPDPPLAEALRVLAGQVEALHCPALQ